MDTSTSTPDACVRTANRPNETRPLPSLNTIQTGDARELSHALPDESIDLIFTDPPYVKEHIHLYGWLALEAERVLKPGGFLLCYVGTYWKYQVLLELGQHLDFFWDFIALNRGNRPVMWVRHVLAGYKSILAFSKGKPAFTGKQNILDVWTGSGEDKRYHIWGQDESTARYYIQNLTRPGDIVLDPFMGGGTTAAVCKLLSRSFLGFEINEEAAIIARTRLETVQPFLFEQEAEQMSIEYGEVAV